MSEENNKLWENKRDAVKRAPRDVKFKPKVPTRKTRKSAVPKTNVPPEGEAAEQQAKIAFAKRSLGLGRKPKTETKTEDMEVDLTKKPTSTTIRSFGPRRCESSEIKSLDIVPFDGVPSHGSTSLTPYVTKKKKPYQEPWNKYSNYPVTLPLRRLDVGDPEILDEEEFGEAADEDYDETKVNAAEELGLMEESDETNMIFLQLPHTLPVFKRAASVKGKEKGKEESWETANNLGLGSGYMGKMLVYKSGAVKLKLGDHLYQVFSGSGVCAESVAAIDKKGKRCNVVGDITRRAVVIPDMDSLSLVNRVIHLD